MKIHEYQGKQLFAQFGVPVLKGIACTDAAAAGAAARELGSPHRRGEKSDSRRWSR